ncbi:MAG TPA: hypothetical protein VF137_05160 [Candidatus Dormibacteraeota bacterium]
MTFSSAWRKIADVTPEARYTALTQQMEGLEDVTHLPEGRGFGSSGQLKVRGRIFAMLVRGELVLKLPRDRVEDLVATGQGRYFDAGKGKPMREWFVLSPESAVRWAPLAEEALVFVKDAK